MLSIHRFALPLIFGLAAATAHADDATIKKNIEAKFPGAKVQSVTKTPYAGLYEVLVEGPQLIYSDDKANYVFMGAVLDLNAQKNLTEERMQKLTAVKFDTLPLGDAIKVVKGNGSRKIAVFSDADCPYCKKFEQELANVTDVTVYTFLYPLEQLHPEAGKKSKQIWCAPDKVKAWDDWMMKGTLAKNDGTCDNPVAKTVQLGQKLGIQGTPTIIFADGRRVPGMVPAAKLEQMLGGKPAAKK
jgi:thiol:disulfide interchange protein DsbC